MFEEYSCSTPLLYQTESMWCWVASAQMLARTNFPNNSVQYNEEIIKKEQQDAVYYIFGDDTSAIETYDWNTDSQNLKNMGGIYTDVAKAAAYFVGLVEGDATFSGYPSPYLEKKF